MVDENFDRVAKIYLKLSDFGKIAESLFFFLVLSNELQLK
jgi:hypothetical protein